MNWADDDEQVLEVMDENGGRFRYRAGRWYGGINPRTGRWDLRISAEPGDTQRLNARVFEKKLEKHYSDMQDIEFTIQEGRLWMLQTRNGKRTAQAAIKVAVDMVKEGLIDEKTAVLRVAPSQLDQLLHPRWTPRPRRR